MPRREGRFGTDDRQMRVKPGGEGREGVRVGGIDGLEPGDATHAGIAGSTDDRRCGRVLPEAPGERVFTPAGADDKGAHSRGPMTIPSAGTMFRVTDAESYPGRPWRRQFGFAANRNPSRARIKPPDPTDTDRVS